MKTIYKYILLLSIITLLSNCGGNGNTDPTPVADPTQAVIDGLAKTWTINSVSLDGSNVASDWNGVSVSFTTNKSFSITGLSTENSLIWASSGSYSFPDATNANKILRNDGVEIKLSNLTDNSATLEFSILERSGGRTNGLIGSYSFNFTN
jgi:hypothetical protein